MKIYNPEFPLISIHIPKCAGSSFGKVLKKWYGFRLFKHYTNEKGNKPPKKHKLTTVFFNKRYKPNICIHGHFNRTRGNGVSDYYPEVDQFITILRNPFEVHISNYFFVKKLGTKAFRDGKLHPIIKENLDLTRYLEKWDKSHLLAFFPPDISIDNYRDIINKHYIYIGIAEDLQTSVDVLAKRLNFPSIRVPFENVSSWDEEIPESLRRDFFRNNPLEMAIYEYALKNYKA